MDVASMLGVGKERESFEMWDSDFARATESIYASPSIRAGRGWCPGNDTGFEAISARQRCESNTDSGQ